MRRRCRDVGGGDRGGLRVRSGLRHRGGLLGSNRGGCGGDRSLIRGLSGRDSGRVRGHAGGGGGVRIEHRLRPDGRLSVRSCLRDLCRLCVGSQLGVRGFADGLGIGSNQRCLKGTGGHCVSQRLRVGGSLRVGAACRSRLAAASAALKVGLRRAAAAAALVPFRWGVRQQPPPRRSCFVRLSGALTWRWRRCCYSERQLKETGEEVAAYLTSAWAAIWRLVALLSVALSLRGVCWPAARSPPQLAAAASACAAAWAAAAAVAWPAMHSAARCGVGLSGGRIARPLPPRLRQRLVTSSISRLRQPARWPPSVRPSPLAGQPPVVHRRRPGPRPRLVRRRRPGELRCPRPARRRRPSLERLPARRWPPAGQRRRPPPPTAWKFAAAWESSAAWSAIAVCTPAAALAAIAASAAASAAAVAAAASARAAASAAIVAAD